MNKYLGYIEAAWETGGRQKGFNGHFLGRRVLEKYLVEEVGMSLDVAKKAVNPNEPHRVIGRLIREKKIVETEGGWLFRIEA